MGSYLELVVCPECKYPKAAEIIYFKTNEVYILCENCGYKYTKMIKPNNKNGKVNFRCTCGHEGTAKQRKLKGKYRYYCRKCNKWFKFFWDYIIYEEIEKKGKGIVEFANIIFTCPKCKKDTLPIFQNGHYYCAKEDCGIEFDDKTVKKMLKRKKILDIYSITQLPNKELLKEIQQRKEIVIIRLNKWNGKPWKEKI